jgi:hypothetical protein
MAVLREIIMKTTRSKKEMVEIQILLKEKTRQYGKGFDKYLHINI